MKRMSKLCFFIASIIVLALGQAQAQTIWEAGSVSFSKISFADWTMEENQDRITNNVWLTRKDFEGLINIKEENEFFADSPFDTEWAFLGLDGNPSTPDAITASNFGNLRFNAFAAALDDFVGSNIVNRPAVLHLISDNIYLNIEFQTWEKGFRDNQELGGGAFSYTRTSTVVPEPVSSILFVAGGMLLAGRRYWKKRKSN